MNGINELLKREGLTQSWLAEKLGIRQGSISLWNKSGVPPERIVEIENVTGSKIKREELRPELYR